MAKVNKSLIVEVVRVEYRYSLTRFPFRDTVDFEKAR